MCIRDRAYIGSAEGRLYQSQARLMAGDRVIHPVFGKGVVLRETDKSYEIEFETITGHRAVSYTHLIGNVFQDPKSQFFSGELVGEVAFACENLGYGKEAIKKRTDKTIAEMGLTYIKSRRLDVLSSGEKQKVATVSYTHLDVYKRQQYSCGFLLTIKESL